MKKEKENHFQVTICAPPPDLRLKKNKPRLVVGKKKEGEHERTSFFVRSAKTKKKEEPKKKRKKFSSLGVVACAIIMSFRFV